jgi:hypothetical protein
MFKAYTKQSNALERFRVKAHLRTYIKDPILVDEKLMMKAVQKLKKMPYDLKDPAGTVAIELVIDAYRLGFYKYENLTDSGHLLVQRSRNRRLRQTKSKSHQGRQPRNRYTLKTI